jgi:uncharacterized protein YukE
MTSKELEQMILKSENTDIFYSLNYNLKSSLGHFEQEFKNILTLHQFLDNQVSGWKKVSIISNSEIEKFAYPYSAFKTKIEQFVTNFHTTHEDEILYNWRLITASFKNEFKFLYNSPTIQFLEEVNTKFPKSLIGALNFMFGKGAYMASRAKNDFIGSMLAYEFELNEDSDISKRRNKEKVSITRLTNNFRKQIEESKYQINNELLEIQSNSSELLLYLEKLKSEKENLFRQWTSESSEKFIEWKDELNEKIKKTEKIHDDFIITSKKNSNEWTEALKLSISRIEKSYDDLLKLKKPADYWRIRAAKLKNEGYVFIGLLTFLVIIGSTSLYYLLWTSPDGMFLDIFKEKSSAIKWSIVYISFISFLAFGIRTLTKVIFSSFHLARDAEEREHLTFVYLSLIKDTTVEEADRNLILQALFSRSDSGLIKGDSAPTLPTNETITKVLGNNN